MSSEDETDGTDDGRLRESGWQKAVAPPAQDKRPAGTPKTAPERNAASPAPKETSSDG